MTLRVLLALLQQQVHGASPRLRVIRWHLEISRSHTNERRSAHPLRMLPHINQRRPRSVGYPDEIDPIVAEPVSHIVEIIHRDGGGVLREIGALLQSLP